MIKFIIITQPRSGSSFLTSSLSSHPQIHCQRGSLFTKRNLSPVTWFRPNFLTVDRKKSPYYKYRSSSLRRQIAHRFCRHQLVQEFLSEWYVKFKNSPVVGFKVNYSQLNRYPAAISWIKDNEVKVIHLVRNNLLKRHVSNLVAIKRNRRHSKVPGELKPTKVHVDTKNILEDFRRRQKRFEKFRRKFRDLPFLEIHYESMLADLDEEANKILRFLSIDQIMPLTTDHVKVNPDALKEIIENYVEVKNTLKNTEFERFLY